MAMRQGTDFKPSCLNKDQGHKAAQGTTYTCWMLEHTFVTKVVGFGEFMKATCRKPQEKSSEAALRHENTLPSKRFALWALQPCNSGLPATRKTSGE
jgi:hypothetical protein